MTHKNFIITKLTNCPKFIIVPHRTILVNILIFFVFLVILQINPLMNLVILILETKEKSPENKLKDCTSTFRRTSSKLSSDSYREKRR